MLCLECLKLLLFPPKETSQTQSMRFQSTQALDYMYSQLYGSSNSSFSSSTQLKWRAAQRQAVEVTRKLKEIKMTKTFASWKQSVRAKIIKMRDKCIEWLEEAIRKLFQSLKELEQQDLTQMIGELHKNLVASIEKMEGLHANVRFQSDDFAEQFL